MSRRPPMDPGGNAQRAPAVRAAGVADGAKAMLCMAVTCGYALVLAMLPDDASGLWFVAVIAMLLTTAATFWALLLVRRACGALSEAVVRWI